MSYRPANERPRGNSELSDDNWTTSSNQDHQSSAYTPNSTSDQALGTRLPYRQTYNIPPLNPQGVSPGGTPNQGLAQNLLPTNNISPEDMLFLRGWQRDSFYYRGWGGLYWYNTTKMLPHSFGRYLFVPFITYPLGKLAYKGELRRRLAANPSNSPFLQGLRRIAGLEPIVSNEFSSDTNMTYGQTEAASGWNDSEFASETAQPKPYGQNNFYQPHEAENNLADRPTSSYDELRARNRGYVK